MKVPVKHLGDNGLFAYHVLRVAVEMFGKQPAELSSDQLKMARFQAEKTLGLEDIALSSPEGARVSVPDAAIDAGVRQIKGRYVDEDAFHDAMRNGGLDEAALRRALWRELAFDAVMSLVGDGIDPVSDEEVETFYDEHPERFVKPELRTARHILITINPDYPDNMPDVAHKRIQDLYERACADPSCFGDLAAKNSECPSALDQGVLGQVPPGKLYASLDAVLFQLGVGEIGGPVETEAGLHIVYCEAIEPKRTVSFGVARDKIRDYLTAQRRKARQKAWLDARR